MNHTRTIAAILIAAVASPAHAQVLKGNQILIDQGLQVQGMATNYDPFHQSTYQAANYTSVNWLWDGPTTGPGTMPWARWARDQSEMPPRAG